MASDGVLSADSHRLTLAGDAPTAVASSSCVQPSSRKRARSLSAADRASPMPLLFPIGNQLSMGNAFAAHVATWQVPRVPLSENLKTLMAQRGLTQSELAKKAAVAKSTLSRYMSGDRETRPSPEHLMKLARALGVKTGELLGEDATLERGAGQHVPTAFDRAAALFPWDAPTSTIREVMARGRAEALESDQPDWFWRLRIQELLDEAAGPRPAGPPPRIAKGS